MIFPKWVRGRCWVNDWVFSDDTELNKTITPEVTEALNNSALPTDELAAEPFISVDLSGAKNGTLEIEIDVTLGNDDLDEGNPTYQMDFAELLLGARLEWGDDAADRLADLLVSLAEQIKAQPRRP